MLVESLKELIVSLSPGSRLPNELELCESFGVSRGNIREAIKHLCELGVLERSTKRGTFVKAPTLKDISRSFAFQLKMAGPGFEELKGTRLFLEQSIAPLLIQLATPMSLDHLNALVSEMEANAGNPRKADALDRQFHTALAEICGNRLIQIFFQVINLTFDAQYREKYLNTAAVMKSVADHRRMIACIKSKDCEGLLAVISEHIHPL
jgi:GntR family transcriptional repressor for pyruvate dehydrogenase complex